MKIKKNILAVFILSFLFIFSANLVFAGYVDNNGNVLPVGDPNIPGGVVVQNNAPEKGFIGIIKMFGSILNAIIPVIVALAIVWTLYFVLKFIKEEGDKRVEYSKSFMFGIVGIFVMLSLWGLINLLDQTFGLDNTPNLNIPTVGTVVAPKL